MNEEYTSDDFLVLICFTAFVSHEMDAVQKYGMEAYANLKRASEIIHHRFPEETHQALSFMSERMVGKHSISEKGINQAIEYASKIVTTFNMQI